MGPPHPELQLLVNSQGYLSVNSKEKSHSPLVAFDLRAGCLYTTPVTSTMHTVESCPKHTKLCVHSKIPSQIQTMG